MKCLRCKNEMEYRGEQKLLDNGHVYRIIYSTYKIYICHNCGYTELCNAYYLKKDSVQEKKE